MSLYNLTTFEQGADLRSHPWVRDPILAFMRSHAADHASGVRLDTMALEHAARATLGPQAVWPEWVWTDCSLQVANEWNYGLALASLFGGVP